MDAETVMRLDRMVSQLNNLTTSDISLAPKPFTGLKADIDNVTNWLRYFDNYVKYRQIDRAAALNLFKLRLTDLAADWLQQLPTATTNDYDALRAAFEARFALNEVQRLLRATSVWQRSQGLAESVDVYVSEVRKLAEQGRLTDEHQIVFAIIRGLQPKIRLQVLNSGAETVTQVIDAARRAEAALALAPDTSEQSVVELSKSVALLVDKLAAKEATSATAVSDKPPEVNAVSDGRTSANWRRFGRRPVQGQLRSTTFTPQRQPPRPQWGRLQQQQPQRFNNFSGNQLGYSCRKCATGHRNGICPAKDQMCFHCNKWGHFAKCCRSTRTAGQQLQQPQQPNYQY
jgi:ribosomal protein L18